MQCLPKSHAVPTSSQSTRLVRPSLRLSHNQNRRECICRSVNSSSLLPKLRTKSCIISHWGSSSSSSGSTPAVRQRCRASASDDSSSISSSSSTSGASATVAPFTDQELLGMAAAAASEEEQELGEVWRAAFEDDLDGLYDYVDRGHMEVAAKIAGLKQIPQHLWEQIGVMDQLERYPPGLVADMMGMGAWRLKTHVDEVFSFLVTRIESSLRELLDTDLALYPTDKWKDKGWDFIDSCDPKQELHGFSYVDLPDPLKGMEGYPRLLIENRIYSSRVFRKLHLEVAVRQDGLQVLHMVFFPRYDFDIPILALDLVAAGGAVTLAIIDTCPVSPRLTLPAHYANTVTELQEHFLPESVHDRKIPEWGKSIFSSQCVCIRPSEPEELAGFMKYAVALTRAHLMYSSLLDPLRPTDKPSARRLSELLTCHQRFVDNQLANQKTARVLEVAFDTDFTEQYMKQLMFDYSPREDVPWFDGSLAKLYEYFEKVPEVWADAAEFLKTRMKLDEQKASEYLNRFLSGDASIKLPRLSFALQHMYEHDVDFQAAVDRSFLETHPQDIPSPSAMGEHLAKQLMVMVYGQQPDQQGEQQQQQQQHGQAEPIEVAASAPPSTETPRPPMGPNDEQEPPNPNSSRTAG